LVVHNFFHLFFCVFFWLILCYPNHTKGCF
jgi:hypothetical protein